VASKNLDIFGISGIMMIDEFGTQTKYIKIKILQVGIMGICSCQTLCPPICFL